MFLVTFLWSFNFITSKIALRQWNPVMLTCLRTTIAFFLMVPLYWQERSQPLGWSRTWRLMALGTLGMAANQIFFALGVKQTSVAHGALIIGMTPVFVYLLTAVIGQETFRPRKFIGLAIALAGIGVLQANATGKSTLLGDSLVLLASLSFTAFTVFSKPLSGRQSPIATVTLNYTGAMLFLLPATIIVGWDYPFHQILPISWACLLFMALVPSVLCFLLYYRVLRGLPASKLSTFTYLQPILAGGMAIPFLGETLSWNLFTGGLLILLGVFATERL
jgi:drug/metabolite transporter (DMT)-like permease